MTDQPFPTPSPITEDTLKALSMEQIMLLLKEIQANCQQAAAYAQGNAKNAGIIRDYIQNTRKI